MIGSDDLPQFLWASDLDGDGKVDVFLNLTNHYNLSKYVLLSTHAKDGEILGKAAALLTSGC